MRRGFHNHIDEPVSIGVAHHLVHYPHGQPARKDEVTPGSEHLFSRLDALVGQKVRLRIQFSRSASDDPRLFAAYISGR